MNGQYIARLPLEELAAACVPLFAGDGPLARRSPTGRHGGLLRLLELLRPRAKRLTDFVEQARPFLAETVEYEPDAVAKHLTVAAAGRACRGAGRIVCATDAL